ncbi:autotransporter domain-containing protein [Enterobacteriaceae bacterium 155047]|uniref:autotransporter family protein n=1 Tax=Huaxiibacter chinensis TaxID=2899785 RepID=UPI002164ECBD|nr:autotransporter domain-containing protein [Huaxiibacter chinensis]MCG5045539.1 autotransporter domain-containing protein [Huaxiibacter chinensis]
MEKKRLSQLISLLVASMATQAMFSPHAYAASGVIIDNAYTSVQVLSSNPLVHVTDSGSINGTNQTALFLGTSVNVETLTNDGTISGLYGIYNSGAIDNLTNAGLITSAGNTLADNGAIYNAGTIGTLRNTGTIRTELVNNYGNSAIYNRGSIDTIINDNDITHSIFGINNQGIINTIENNGQINADTFGILSNDANGTALGTITNNGLITAGSYGIFITSINNQNQATHIVNNGEISSNGYALFLNANFINNLSANAQVTLTNNGLVKGNIYSNSLAPLSINGGTQTTGTLTGNNGIGSITSYRSDVVFGTGSLLLNDNVTANNGTVRNDAASLQINDAMTVTGNYHQKAAATLISGISDLATHEGSITADTGYGRLKVTGDALVEAGSQVNLLRTGTTYKFAEGQRYVVISAAGANTDYHADKLNYEAIGYRGAVTGSVYEEGVNKALVLTVGAEPEITPPVVTPPVVTPPVVTPPVVTPPVVTPPVVTPPVVTPPVVTPPVVTPPVVTPPVVTPPVVTPPVVTPPVVTDPAPTTPNKPGQATIPGATAALGGLANYTGIASPQLLNLYNASLALEGKQASNRAGESLSPAQNLNASAAATVATSTAQAVVGSHMDAVRNPASSGTSGIATGDDYSSNWIVWGQPFGGYARQDSHDDVSGYSAKFGGLLLGADRALGDDWRLGAAVNYSNTSVHGKDNLSGNTSTADNYGVIGYAGFTGDPWYLNLSAGLNRQNYSSVRRADFTGFSGAAKGKFNGQSVTLQTEFGYPFTLPANVVLTPLASLTYGYQHVDGYKETGGNGMALDVSSTHAQSVISDIGARIEKTVATGFGNLTPFVQVSWIHQYDQHQVSSRASYAADAVGETSFSTKGASPVKDMAGVAVGTTLYEGNDLSFDARYDLQAGERYQAHTFSLRLRKTF